MSLTIDGLPVVVPLSATSDVDAVSGEVCDTHKLDAAQCGQLREALAQRQNPWTVAAAGRWSRAVGRRRGNLMLLWFSFASMASRCLVTVLGPAGGPLPRAGRDTRPVCGGEISPELPTGARDRSKGYVPEHLARKGASAVPTASDVVRAVQRLARSVALGQPGGRVKRSRTTNQRLRQVRTNHLQPGSTAGSGHAQTDSTPDRTTTTSHERRRDRGGGAPAPKKSIFACFTNLPGVCVPQKGAEPNADEPTPKKQVADVRRVEVCGPEPHTTEKGSRRSRPRRSTKKRD